MSNHSRDLRNIVAETTAQLAHYRSLMDKLLAKRESAQLQLDSIVYPILSLPPEVTSEIFLSCLPTSYTDPNKKTANPKEAPMLLSHVCRTWRKVALSTPALWCELEFDLRHANDNHVLKTWLSRARELPLSLKLNLWTLGAQNTDFLDTFDGWSHRMRSLELRLGIDQLRAIEGANDDWSFSLLQTVTVRLVSLWLYRDVTTTTNHPFQMFRNSPLLREVSLARVPPSSISLPWHQLSKFTGESFTFSACLEILRLVPTLTECTFVACHKKTPDLQTFTHLNLQSFTVVQNEGENGGNFDILTFVSLPALQALRLELCFPPDNFENTLDGFLLRSSPPLQKIVIFGAEYYMDLDSPLFLRMPRLVDLEVREPTAEFIENFFASFNDQDTTFLPHLQHLALVGFLNPLDEMLESALAGLSARWRAQSRAEFAKMESVRFVWWDSEDDDFEEDVLLPFQKLVADGMNICIQRRDDMGDLTTIVFRPDSEPELPPPPPDTKGTYFYGYKLFDDCDERIKEHEERLADILFTTCCLGLYVRLTWTSPTVMVFFTVYDPKVKLITPRAGNYRIPGPRLREAFQEEIEINFGPTWHVDDSTIFRKGLRRHLLPLFWNLLTAFNLSPLSLSVYSNG
ncbi:hypothetical protein B0H17DRAFT_1333617 [Mycena rosella]|uniref:F-box domain-containing protein n=1 Tax=Mycena rosella TaxID=1033263 RepID=A0AAD7GDU4_MYCRO|nr:hypothetical protein B0H17DRAFT_1333617 [Mycena rosella]